MGQGECAKIPGGVSGPDGQFRMGPPALLQIQPSSSSCPRAAVQVERTIPSHSAAVDNGDVKGLDLIALSDPAPAGREPPGEGQQVRRTMQVKNIKAKLFCGNSDSPITLSRWTTPSFTFSLAPSDHKECYITVEASAVQPTQSQDRARLLLADKHRAQGRVGDRVCHGRGDIGQASKPPSR